MKRTYNINLVEGHLLISDNGNTFLVDTGSPITVQCETNLSFLDRDFSAMLDFKKDLVVVMC